MVPPDQPVRLGPVQEFQNFFDPGSVRDFKIFLVPSPVRSGLSGRDFKGSSHPKHLIFEINVGKSRIRHTATLKYKDEFLDRLKINRR